MVAKTVDRATERPAFLSTIMVYHDPYRTRPTAPNKGTVRPFICSYAVATEKEQVEQS